MSKPTARYQIKIDESLGLVISPYLYTKFWTDKIEICHECNSLRFSPINDSIAPDNQWPKVITVSVNRCVVFNMEGEEE